MSVNLSEYLSGRLPTTRHVERDTDEWGRMWSRLFSRATRSGYPVDGWQYMGTKRVVYDDIETNVHTFRLRAEHNPPPAMTRITLNVRMADRIASEVRDA